MIKIMLEFEKNGNSENDGLNYTGQNTTRKLREQMMDCGKNHNAK